MASTDWDELADGLDATLGAEVIRGVTGGLGTPPGGAAFVLAARTPPGGVTDGTWGLHTAQVDFTPMALGGRVSGVLRSVRTGGSGAPGVAPFLFASVAPASVSSVGYLLGLTDAEQPRIALVKGPLTNGVPHVAPGTLGVLKRSSSGRELGAWVHLALEVTMNVNGDVVLNVFENDLAAHPLGTDPVWKRVDGIDRVIDDRLETETGAAPLGVTYDGGGNVVRAGGYAGFGARHAGTGVACFDWLKVSRQTP